MIFSEVLKQFLKLKRKLNRFRIHVRQQKQQLTFFFRKKKNETFHPWSLTSILRGEEMQVPLLVAVLPPLAVDAGIWKHCAKKSQW